MFASPFLSPEFTMCAARIWPGVEVAVLESSNRVVGFFPFERSGRRGCPVGRRIAFHQGAILEPGVDVDPRALVRACGLREWHFTNLLTSQAAFAPNHRGTGVSLRADLSAGFASYLETVTEARPKMVAEIRRKGRKIARDIGPLRLVAQEHDASVFDDIERLKLDKYRCTGPLRDASCVELMRRMLATDTPRFAGCMTALYAGDRLIAGSIGVRSRTMFVGIIIAYDEELARHSPGSVLLLEMLEAFGNDGITTFDFGYGDQEYKRRWASDALEVAEGFVAVNRLARAKCEVREAVRERQLRLLNDGALGPDRAVGRMLRTLREEVDIRMSR